MPVETGTSPLSHHPTTAAYIVTYSHNFMVDRQGVQSEAILLIVHVC